MNNPPNAPKSISVARNLYRDSDFAPVDYATMDSVQCTCDDPQYADACIIHGKDSTWTPPTVVTRYLTATEVPSNITSSQLDEAFRADIDYQTTRTVRYGNDHINHASRTLEDFNKNFKVTEEHKEHQRKYLEKLRIKAPTSPEKAIVEEAPTDEQEPEKPGVLTRICKGFKALDPRGAGDGQKTKWFSSRRRKQSISPVETAPASADEASPNKSSQQSTFPLHHTTSLNMVGSGKGDAGKSSMGGTSTDEHPPSVEELQARSASVKYDPYNSSRSVNGGWEVMPFDASSWRSFDSVKKENQYRRSSQGSSASQPTRAKPQYPSRKSFD